MVRYMLLCLSLLVLIPSRETLPYHPHIILTTANNYNIDIEQVKYIESLNNPKVTSHDGAIGLMQITPIALKEWNLHNTEKYSRKDLFNPSINVKIGEWFLHDRIPEILETNKIPVTINHVLMSYNWGAYSVVKWYKKGGNYSKIPEETKTYLNKYWSKY